MRALVLWADDRSTNLGVRVLAAGSVAWLQRALGDVEVECHNYGAAVAPTRIGDPRALLREQVTGREGLREFYRGFDLVVDTRGGDSFADIYGLQRLVAQTGAEVMAARAGVPVVLGPQTVGPFGSAQARALARLSLSHASAVLARDSVSAQVARRLGRPVDATTTDLVFSLPVPTVTKSRDVLLNVSGLLWQPNSHVDYAFYRETVRKLVAALRADGRSVGLLAHVIDSPDPDNDVPAIAEFVGGDSDVEVLVPTSLDDVREMVASANLVIGSRMHACLNSLSLGTPAIPLAYSRKFAPLLGDLGWAHVVDLRAGGDPAGAAEAVRTIVRTADLENDTRALLDRAANLTDAADQVLREVVDGTRRRGKRAPATEPTLADRIDDVVTSQRCSGCGACTTLDPGLSMQYSDAGFARPVMTGASAPVDDAVATFDAVCPGVVVSRPAIPGAAVHPVLGPYLGCWEAYAADPEIRFDGSSGGVLTALTTWLVETGRASAATAVAADPEQPRRTVPVTITSRDDALRAAGSRYAPVGAASAPAADVFVGKPCEASAVRRLVARTPEGPEPLVLSFFCAGTPSQHATDRLARDLGVDDEAPVTDLWYRGRGWPGSFTVVTGDGSRVSTSYDESWGKALGPTVQWRCKICPDGVGESADIAAGDFWESDERGYPVFTEGAGRSALIARTRRGLDLIREAAAEGVIVIADVEPDAIAGIQPLQTQRRATLAARLAGAKAAGRAVPAYRGFDLVSQAARQPRAAWRMAKGSFRRVRNSRAEEER